jgi:hypothetical protein
MLSLHELLEKVINEGHLRPSRIAPLRTAVKQYAAMHGTDPKHCLPEVYHLSDPLLRQFIDQHASVRLGSHALRNLKNNLVFLLHLGVTLRLIDPLKNPLISWKNTRVRRDWHRHAGLNPPPQQDRYLLRHPPAKLANEIEQYADWCMSAYAADRPAAIRKRPVTMKVCREHIWRVAGYLVHERQLDPETFSLQVITEPALLTAFTGWFTERRGKVTGTIHRMLRSLHVIRRYWLKDEAGAKQISHILACLPPAERVYDHQRRWLSLAQLESIGLSRHPLNKARHNILYTGGE